MFEYDYQHKVHSRAKNLKLRVLPNGSLQVTTPRWTPQWQIKHFITQNQDWINKQLAHLPKPSDKNQVPAAVQLFGRLYQLKIKYDHQLPIGLHIFDDFLILNPANPDLIDGQWHQIFQKQLDRFLKKTARAYIFPRTTELAKKMHITYGRISLKEQSSRWGSCSSMGNLNFNWRLVHCPPDVIDYVVIHELSHRQEMNHSRAFWQLVESYDPAYKLHRGWLKRHGGNMMPC